MAEVDTSIYRNQPNPLGMISNVYNVMNSAQQLQLGQQVQQIRQFELQKQQADDLRMTAGSLYNTNATPEQVKAAILLRARQGGYHPDVVNNYLGTLDAPETQKDFPGFLKNERAQAAQTGGLLATQPVYPAGGGTMRNVPAASVPVTGAPAANPPGFEEVARGPAGAEGISNMASIANDAPNQKALLANLNDLSNEAITGPTSDWEKRANALAGRLFPGKGLTLTPTQLAKSEEYGKISEQLAGQQAVAAHSTNAFLTNAYNTNPSLYLSKIGRQGITHMLQGNVDSIVAKNNSWDAYANGEMDGQKHSPAEFANWNRTFNSDFNPRVFQYARMTPEERSSFRSAMPVNQQKKFFQQVQSYQAKNWIDLSGQ